VAGGVKDMRTMNKQSLLLALPLASLVAAPLLAGCGSSSDPRDRLAPAPAPTATNTADAGAPDAPASPTPAVRTMKTGALLPASPKNLLLDPNFAETAESWGHFLTFASAATIETRTFSTSPAGVGAPVAIVVDESATDEKGRLLTILSSFVGGPGPYRAGVWISHTTIDGAPTPFPEDATTATASITSMTGAAKSWDLARDATVVSGGRTWIHLRADIAEALPGGGFLNLKVGRVGGRFLLAGPEVVPLSVESGVTTKSLRSFAVARPSDGDELGAIAAYRRMPIKL
jgi:hypothetical protein